MSYTRLRISATASSSSLSIPKRARSGSKVMDVQLSVGLHASMRGSSLTVMFLRNVYVLGREGMGMKRGEV